MIKGTLKKCGHNERRRLSFIFPSCCPPKHLHISGDKTWNKDDNMQKFTKQHIKLKTLLFLLLKLQIHARQSKYHQFWFSVFFFIMYFSASITLWKRLPVQIHGSTEYARLDLFTAAWFGQVSPLPGLLLREHGSEGICTYLPLP